MEAGLCVLFTKHISVNAKKRVSIFKGLLMGSATAQAVGGFGAHFMDEEPKATGEGVDNQVPQLAGEGGSRRKARDLRMWPPATPQLPHFQPSPSRSRASFDRV